MTVVVRADAGVDVGVGHIVRCSALLRRLGIEPESMVLVTSSLTPSIHQMVEDGTLFENSVPIDPEEEAELYEMLKKQEKRQ